MATMTCGSMIRWILLILGSLLPVAMTACGGGGGDAAGGQVLDDVEDVIEPPPSQPEPQPPDPDPDPTPPPSYSGMVVTDILGTDDFLSAIALQPDGKIVAVGRIDKDKNLADHVSDYDFLVVRYNPDGSLDKSFGSGGIVTTDIETSSDSATAVAIRDDGRIVAVGYFKTSSGDDNSVVVRYTSSGAVDSFPPDPKGYVAPWIVKRDVSESGQDDRARAVTIDPKTRQCIVAGDCKLSGTATSDTYVLRLNENGTKAWRSVNDLTDGNFDDYGRAISLTSTGTVVVGGYGYSSSSDQDFCLSKYDNATGALQFHVLEDMGSTQDRCHAIALLPGGKILMAGQTGKDSPNYLDFVLARFTNEGDLDTTWGTSGKLVTNFEEGPYDIGRSVAVDSEGRILLAGSVSTDLYNKSSKFAVVRYLPDLPATSDPSFDGDGRAILSPKSSSLLRAMAIQSDSKVILAGSVGPSNNHDFAVVRLNVDGSLDNTFGAP